MSATVQAQAGPLQTLDAPESLPALLRFNVRFVADPPVGNHFVFRDASEEIIPEPIFPIESVQVIEILLEDATFSEDGIEWINQPLGLVQWTMMDTPTRRVFQVDAPVSVLTPWIFKLVVDTTLGEQESPEIFLILGSSLLGDEPIERLDLHFDSSNHEFRLRPTGSVGDIVQLSSGQFLVFALLAGHECTLEINLLHDPSNPPADLSWSPEPILWNSGQPSWVTTPAVDSSNDRRMTLTIEADEQPSIRTAGFRFAIELDEQTIQSPDPILVNATIGDG